MGLGKAQNGGVMTEINFLDKKADLELRVFWGLGFRGLGFRV